MGEGSTNAFVIYSKRLVFVTLLSYFIWKVVMSVEKYNREEANLHIHNCATDNHFALLYLFKTGPSLNSENCSDDGS